MIGLADEFKDQPVAVLGINSDTEVDDARRVIDYFKIRHATLRDEHDGTSIHEMYKVTMWPTAIVLDRRGVPRHVHCGYWPTMQRSLTGKIRELMEEDGGSLAVGRREL